MKKIIFILVLLACIVPAVSAAGFVWNPTNPTDYHTYQGERITGYLDNTLAESVSVVQYEWFDGSQTQYLTFARGYDLGYARTQGAAMYSSLPGDGNWWMTTSPTGTGFWGSSFISEVYFATSSVGREESFYAGYPNQDNDLKTNTLTIRLYDRSTNPQLIQTITKTYFIHRLYPFSHVDVWTENPYTAGSDIASQMLQFNASTSPYSVYTIDHYMLTDEGNPIMGMRFFKKWDSSTNQWLDTYWRQYLTNNEWGEWSGDYTWDEAYLGTFSVPLEEGNYTLRTTFYDYKGRSHYNCVFDTPVNVISTLDKYYIRFEDSVTGEPVINNVDVTLRKPDGTTLFSGYLQGEEMEVGFVPPWTVQVTASADGYRPLVNTVTKTFTAEDNELVYMFVPIQSEVGTSTNFYAGNLLFTVKEAGTYAPISNAKITIYNYDYFLTKDGTISVTLPATQNENKFVPFSPDSGTVWTDRFMGDWDGDGIDTPGVYTWGYDVLGTYYPGTWSLYDSNSADTTINEFTGGDWDEEGIPVIGDWDGDGIDTVGMFVGNGQWYLATSNSAEGINGVSPFIYGMTGDIPVTGDWDGDSIDEVGVYRSAGGLSPATWYLASQNSAGGGTLTYVSPFGTGNDYPFSGSWNGDAYDTIGLRVSDEEYILADSLSVATMNTIKFYTGKEFNAGLIAPTEIRGHGLLIGDVTGSGIDKVGYFDYNDHVYKMPVGAYDYTVSAPGRPTITGTATVYNGESVPINIIMPKITSITPITPGDRPEGKGIGLLQVLSYLMDEEGIEDEEEQNIVLGMLIIAFAVVMVGGLVAGGYGVLVGGVFGFILSVIVGFIPIWIPLSFIALGGIYILMKVIGGDS